MSNCSTKIRQYTIELVFKLFIDPSVYFGKIIDFKNRTKDDGFYIFNSKDGPVVTFTPGGGAGKNNIIDGHYNQVVITRDVNEKVVVYLNKIKQFEFYDYEKRAVIETKNLSFFIDDNVTNDENYKYLVSKINIYPKSMSSAEVMDLDVFHGVVNICPTGTPEPTFPPPPTPTPEICINEVSNIPNKLYVYKDCPDSTTFTCSTTSLYYLGAKGLLDSDEFIP